MMVFRVGVTHGSRLFGRSWGSVDMRAEAIRWMPRCGMRSFAPLGVATRPSSSRRVEHARRGM